MRTIKKEREWISTILSFALLPLSGFATDIYIPSLPAMAESLHSTNTAIQLSLVFFLVSYGVAQLFVGSLLDSFGRFKINIVSLCLFSAASFVIATTHHIHLIYLMRIVHGITVAAIVVGKRAYFVDIFSGDKLKHYTSLFSIVWSAAPIIAPFAGGYLQKSFGWESNFYFLGSFAFVMVILELLLSGESLDVFHKFHLRSIVGTYISIVRSADFSLGLLILGLCYSMLMVYGMASPFIIEHTFHDSAVTTGYCSLLSGLSLMAGGFISKSLIRQRFFRKIGIANILQLLIVLGMIWSASYRSDLYTFMLFVSLIHITSGFIFNSFFAYCLSRFPKNAGMASGITGGGLYVVTSILSYGIVRFIPITEQRDLGFGYLALIALITAGLFCAKRYRLYDEGARS